MAGDPRWLGGAYELAVAFEDGPSRAAFAVVEEDEGRGWAVFYLPLGALREHDPRVAGYPFADEGSLAWRAPLDAWPAGVAAAFAERHPFGCALIGFQVSGQFAPGDEIPADRSHGLVLPGDAGPRHLPATY